MSISVSVIVPVYNAATTLDQTFNSLFEEIARSPDIKFEIIAVDDGSTDDSRIRLKNWEHKLPLKVFTISASGNPATPRNYGILQATSEFVFFLDADDVLLPYGLSNALHQAVSQGADVVLVRLKSLDGRGVPRGMFKRTCANVHLVDSRIYWALNPMKVARLDLIKQNEISFYDNFKVGEDQPFCLKLYLAASNIAILAKPPVVGVRYTKSRDNFSLKWNSPNAYFELVTEMLQILKAHHLSSTDIDYLAIRHWEIEFGRELVWNNLPLAPDTEWEKSFQRLEEFAKESLSEITMKQISIRWRGIARIVKFGNRADFVKLVRSRHAALTSPSLTIRMLANCRANWIRLKKLHFT